MTRRRLYGFAALVVVVVGLSAFLVTRNTRQEVRADGSPAPGFDATDRSPDDAPFEFAEPTTTAGPTTLVIDPSERTTTTTSTTTTTTSTTTTTLPTEVLVASNIDSVCGLSDSIQSLYVVFTRPRSGVESIMTKMLDNLVQYVAVSPPEIRDDVVGLRADVARLTELLRSAGWNTRSPAALDAVAAIQARRAPYEFLTDRVGKILFYESAVCPR